MGEKGMKNYLPILFFEKYTVCTDPSCLRSSKERNKILMYDPNKNTAKQRKIYSISDNFMCQLDWVMWFQIFSHILYWVCL